MKLNLSHSRTGGGIVVVEVCPVDDACPWRDDPEGQPRTITLAGGWTLANVDPGTAHVIESHPDMLNLPPDNRGLFKVELWKRYAPRETLA